MPWLALELELSAEIVEWWTAALFEAGAVSVDIADAQASSPAEQPLYGEPGGAIPESAWQQNAVTALFNENTDIPGILSGLSREVDLPSYRIAVVADQDWVRATQEQFGPISISERLWIVPSWCAPPRPDAINLVIDPGLAFGTGAHPSTRLCLQWLEAHLGDASSFLDYGCGSGILAIAAAKLGGRSVVGVDIDDQAVAAARDNAERNRVQATFAPANIPLNLQAEVLMANILANPLRVLAPALASHVCPGGRVVLSGILVDQADEVIAAYAPWFNMHIWREQEGWVALAGLRLA